MGRLTRDPEVRYSQIDGAIGFARYTLAVDRRFKKDAEQTADFISCVTFGKGAEFANNYLHKGMKIVVSGRIQTGKYTNKEGQTIYTTDVVVEDHEFAESKGAGSQDGDTAAQPATTQNGLVEDENGFVHVPDDIDLDDLPFK